MKTQTIVLCAIVAITSGCATFTGGGSPDESIQSTVISTDQAMQTFLAGRELDPIEGAWEHEESKFEFVISRNNFEIAPGYDYVGVITRTDQPFWENGDVKLLLRTTDTAGVFDGVWTTRNKVKREMTFVFERGNRIQANFESNDGNTYFVRVRRMNPRLAAAY